VAAVDHVVMRTRCACRCGVQIELEGSTEFCYCAAAYAKAPAELRELKTMTTWFNHIIGEYEIMCASCVVLGCVVLGVKERQTDTRRDAGRR
jgi:hypothetical protein